MKNVKTLIAAAVLSSLSFASFAAVEVQATPEGQQKFGTISANGGTNLGSLEDQLAQKAEEMGAKSFRITSSPSRRRIQPELTRIPMPKSAFVPCNR